MTWGIQTWDANGIPNNYGIKPVSVIDHIPLAAGQTSGSWSYSVPAGFKVGFVISLDAGAVNVGRRIEANGNTITISSANSVGSGNYPASACELVVFLEKN